MSENDIPKSDAQPNSDKRKSLGAAGKKLECSNKAFYYVVELKPRRDSLLVRAG